MTFGERLKQLRTEKNMKQDDLAAKINVSKSSIGMYERDERQPSFEIVEKISVFFNRSIDYLITGENFHVNLTDNPLIIDISDFSNDDIKFIKQYISFINWKDGQEIEDN